MSRFRAPSRDLRRFAVGWRWRVQQILGTPVPSEYDEDLAATIKQVRRHTLTTAPRIATLCDSVEYLVREHVEGPIVECGVWRGGSMMAVALTLLRVGDTDRDLYLFDTFSGMAEPSPVDVPSPYDGYSMHRRWRRRRQGNTSDWAAIPMQQVRANMISTGYPTDRIHLVPGLVEDTLAEHAPQHIALLRLDTDWYASTKHELIELYPRLRPSGVLIIDDYGHYEGARRAVDEYFSESDDRVLLSRIDFSGRLAVKQGPAPGGRE